MRRVLSWILAVTLLFSNISFTVYAEETVDDYEEVAVEEMSEDISAEEPTSEPTEEPRLSI